MCCRLTSPLSSFDLQNDLQAYYIYDSDNSQLAHLIIAHIYEWSKASLLNLSLDKIKIMHF